MRVRPFSSAKNAWLLSPPSTVLLFSSPDTPRKLTSPKLPSGTAPGVDNANVDHLRPLIGRLSMVVELMLVEKSARSVVITGASAVAMIVSVWVCTPSVASMVVVRPTSTVMLVALYAANPVAVISTEYTPGAKWVIRKRPPSSLLPLALAPVPRFLVLTLAFGTTAPDWSVTVPPIAPFVVDCAKAPEAKSSMAIKARQYRAMGVPIPVVLIEIPPFIELSTPRAQVRGPENPPGWSGGSPIRDWS